MGCVRVAATEIPDHLTDELVAAYHGFKVTSDMLARETPAEIRLQNAVRALVAHRAAFKVGDIAKPIYRTQLHCGSGIYSQAIVVSVNPFVLVSDSSDMRWGVTVHPSEFINGGHADQETITRCMRRLEQ